MLAWGNRFTSWVNTLLRSNSLGRGVSSNAWNGVGSLGIFSPFGWKLGKKIINRRNPKWDKVGHSFAIPSCGSSWLICIKAMRRRIKQGLFETKVPLPFRISTFPPIDRSSICNVLNKAPMFTVVEFGFAISKVSILKLHFGTVAIDLCLNQLCSIQKIPTTQEIDSIDSQGWKHPNCKFQLTLIAL